MEEKQTQEKIRYVKPEVLDLGPVLPAVGGTCSPLGNVPTGKQEPCTAGTWVAECATGTGGYYATM